MRRDTITTYLLAGLNLILVMLTPAVALIAALILFFLLLWQFPLYILSDRKESFSAPCRPAGLVAWLKTCAKSQNPSVPPQDA